MIGFAKERFRPLRLGTMPKVIEPKHVVVVGGGLAGAAAATILAERGVSVTMLEKEPVLGGRVSAWTEKLKTGEPFEMERGFHAFFRQYYNLRELIKRFDPDFNRLTPLNDYPIYGPDGAVETFMHLPTIPPLNVAALVMRTKTLEFGDLIKTNAKAALEMLVYDRKRTYPNYDSMTARDYLDSLNFPPHARRMLFDVFSHSFFNPEEQMSAGELLMMFHFYFLGNIEGLIFDVLNEPFSDALWLPFQRYLEGLGVKIKTKTEVTHVERSKDGSWKVFYKGRKSGVKADGVVLATTVPGLQKIVSASESIDDTNWQSMVDGLELTLPFAVWRLWFDKPAKAGRHPFVGTAGLGNIDNISLYELFEGESRRWALRNNGSIIEIHAYAVPESEDEKSIKEFFIKRLYELYPETRDAKIIEERFLWRQDCPAFKPGTYETRPEVATPMAGLTLAGDFVKIPIPSALMERATASGFMAANHLLADWDVRGEEIWSVPQKGILSGLPI